MNGYERIKAALSGHPTDKIPVMLHNFMMAAREAGVNMEQFRNDPGTGQKENAGTAGYIFRIGSFYPECRLRHTVNDPLREPENHDRYGQGVQVGGD